MPVVCCLTRKLDGASTENGGLTFQEIDAELCEHLSVNCDPVKWVNSWYDHHAFLIALGKTLPEIIQMDKDAVVEYINSPITAKHYATNVKIGEYLLANYTTDAWREHKRNSA